jgi:hypothetical protein
LDHDRRKMDATADERDVSGNAGAGRSLV